VHNLLGKRWRVFHSSHTHGCKHDRKQKTVTYVAGQICYLGCRPNKSLIVESLILESLNP